MAQVSDYTAILTSNSWAGRNASAAPAFVTFSFETTLRAYVDTDTATQAFLESFRTFTTAEKAAARAALQQWSDASGLIFLEVEGGRGDISFGAYDFSLDPAQSGFAGFSYYPYVDVSIASQYSYVSDIGGDLFMDLSYAGNTYVLLHEIGHALGFKHPFSGNPTLDPALDNHANTVMSYTGNFPGVLGVFDLQAVAHVYGAAGSGGSHLASWAWKAARMVLQQTGLATDDTIFGISVRDVINGGAGGDLLAGFGGNDRLIGGTGDDRIFGGDGNDTLRGGRGLDHLYGEDGNDRFEFTRPNDGMDTIYWFSNSAGDNDALRFKADAFGALGRGADGLGIVLAKHFQSSFSPDAATADARFIYERDTGFLFYDADGTGSVAAIHIATFNNYPTLTVEDIILY